MQWASCWTGAARHSLVELLTAVWIVAATVHSFFASLASALMSRLRLLCHSLDVPVADDLGSHSMAEGVAGAGGVVGSSGSDGSGVARRETAVAGRVT